MFWLDFRLQPAIYLYLIAHQNGDSALGSTVPENRFQLF